MITEKDMQYVLTIANYGNLTKAANALFLSQPALSIHLKQLETSLGIQLFERKGRRMILTYAGEEFVKSARDITMKCFELEDRMIDIGKNVAVKLRIGYMVRQVESLFPSVMTAFNRLYPQSVVYAIDGHLSDHEEQLLAGDLDMFFGYNSVSNTRLSYETIYEDCLDVELENPRRVDARHLVDSNHVALTVVHLGLVELHGQRDGGDDLAVDHAVAARRHRDLHVVDQHAAGLRLGGLLLRALHHDFGEKLDQQKEDDQRRKHRHHRNDRNVDADGVLVEDRIGAFGRSSQSREEQSCC